MSNKYNGEFIIKDVKAETLNELYADIREEIDPNYDLVDVDIPQFKYLTKNVLNSIESAREFTREKERGWHDRCTAVVPFREIAKSSNTKKLDSLEERLNKEKEKLNSFIIKEDVKNRKSKLIGCPRCNSKINKDYIRNNSCCVCGNELRSETVLNRIAGYENNIQKLKEEIVKEKEKIASKKSNEIDTKYLVTYYVRVGL